MRNSVYPFFTSQLCGSGFGGGNNEIQIPVSDISLNICGSGLFHEHHQHVGSYAPLSREDIHESFNSIHFQDSFVFGETPLRTDQNDRKRKSKTVMEESKKHRSDREHPPLPCQDHSSESGEKKAPVKRSQKISDKITVLQKLVSPFGKTDTASVLQEAHSYIKYLQEQVEMLSAPYFTIRPLHSLGVGSNNKDLSSRGLCLVPVSFTQKLTKDDKLQRRSSQRASFPRNY